MKTTRNSVTSWVSRSQLARYGTTLLAVAIALAASLLLYPITQRLPFVFFFGAIAYSAAYGGLKPGILATFLTVILADYFLLPPYHLLIFTPTDMVLFGAFGCVAVFTSAIGEARKRAESLLEQQRESLRITLSSIGDAVIATDTEGYVTFMNPIAEKLTGWNYAEALGVKINDVFIIINETTRQAVENPVHKVLQEGAIVGLANHTLLISKNGKEYYIDDSGAPIRDQHGKLNGAVLTFRDVSERRRSEAIQQFLIAATDKLAVSLDYEATFKTIAQLAIPSIADWCAIDVLENGQLRQLIVIGKELSLQDEVAELRERLLNSPDANHNPNPMMQVAQTGKTLFIPVIPVSTIPIVPPDERAVQLLRTMKLTSQLYVPMIVRGQVKGVLTLCTSGWQLTEHHVIMAEELARRAAVALENAQLFKEAREAVHARDEFLSIAAHELRTPITSLRGFSQTLLRQIDHKGNPDPVALKRGLATMNEQSVKLTHLVNDLLDVSRLEAGRLTLSPVMTDLNAVIKNICDNMQSTTQRHKITFIETATINANVDVLRLEQVLINLLDNAIKYSPDGGTITIELSAPTADTACIAVTDQGLGIPLERRAHIFDRFYQAHSAPAMGGMGLGLYISHQIIALHQGKLDVEFPEAGGSRFIITLPRQPESDKL